MKIDLNHLKSKINTTKNPAETASTLNRDIAVIGMACKFPSSENIAEFWETLRNGTDCIKKFPVKREKYGNNFLENQSRYEGEDGYFEGGFLDNVDLFDNEFFGISPMEASLMSPDQRNFLQVVWSAIEDSGYGGDRLKGSKTGIFLGHSTDFGVSYKEFIDALNPAMASFAISGNLNAIIASRLSYLLDLKGPSVNVDTACSSALVAIHTACRSLRDGECRIAIAGASKIDNLPLKSIKKKEDELGITSPDGRTRAFDAASQGTGLGEGIGVIILKPLEQARKDGDNIHAVIKGSAINQDGTSANLTSPNPDAQAEVIIKAWQDAKVHPESISYIEAHGTGTKLGDPIEINGITKAFRQYTEKLQFCGIGSVKSNIGHLDNAAGMAGMIKIILSLKNKAIPESLYFQSANDKISFETSPVFVNSVYRQWVTEGKRRCGISGFGLSGTNCHIILEEAEDLDDRTVLKTTSDKKIITLSARNKQELLTYLWKYQVFLNTTPHIDLNNLCYTANTGRNHFSSRLAIIFGDLDDLKIKLEEAYLYCMANIKNKDIFYGDEVGVTDSISDSNLRKDDLSAICTTYVQGGEIDWNTIYDIATFRKVSLPTYPFAGIPHWIETVNPQKGMIKNHTKENMHPLIHSCLVKSFDTIVYSSQFSVADDWILNEHLVAKVPVIPGTVYIEMVTEVVKRNYAVLSVNLSDLVFLAPLALEHNDAAEVHTVIKNTGDKLSFTVASKTQNTQTWIVHAEGKIDLIPEVESEPLDLDNLKKRCKDEILQEFAYEDGEGIELSERWNCVRNIYANEDEILAYVEMKEEYKSEISDYTLHPALLDEAINITLRTIGEGIYLPFSYKKLVIYKSLPECLYSYVCKKKSKGSTKELATFDVILTDMNGNIIAKALDYTIKKIDINRLIGNHPTNTVVTYQLSQVSQKWQSDLVWNSDETIVILKGIGNTSQFITDKIKENAVNVMEIESKDNMKTVRKELKKVVKLLQSNKSVHLINLLALDDNVTLVDLNQLQRNLSYGVYGFIDMIKVLIEYLKNTEVQITVIGESAMPANAALFGLGSALHDEYRQIQCKCISIDSETEATFIVNEIFSKSNDQMVFYKKNERFINQLIDLDMQDYEKDSVSVREQGVYIITGGTGGVGLLIAEYLSAYHANIILLNRSAFPEQDQWEEILLEKPESKLREKISKLKEMTGKGANVFTYAVDISNGEMLERTLCEIRNKFEKINGIFHAAGVAGNGFLIRRQEEAIKGVIAPKTEGTYLLDTLTRQDDIDFFVLFSSISSIIPEAGQCDYGAANGFLDAYADDRNRSGRKTIAINWPAFSETGMAVDFGVDLHKEIFQPIKNNEAMMVLDWVIHHKVSHVIVGELNYTNFIKNNKYKKLQISRKIISANLNKGMQGNSSNNQKRNNQKQVELVGGNGSYTQTEYKVASIIGNALGRTSLDISDGFLQMGGNSILAVKVEIDMEEQGLSVTLSDLYAYQSIRELAVYIDSNGETDSAKISTMVPDKIGELQSGYILADVEPFVDLIYKGCFNSALLSGIGHFHRSPLYFLMNDVIVYDFSEETKIESFGVKYIPLKTFDDTVRQAGLLVKERLKSNDIIADLTESITIGKPVIVTIDCYYESISQDCYGREHSPHSILVYGCDEEKKLFYIIEHRTSESALYEKMQMTYAELKECYLGYCEQFEHLDMINSKNESLIYDYHRDCPTYFELEETKSEDIVTQEQLWELYLHKLIECSTLEEEGLKLLWDFKDRLIPIISEEAILREKQEQLIAICNVVISGQKVKQYQFNHFLQEFESVKEKLFHTDIFMGTSVNLKLKEIITHWDKIRNIVLKYSFTNVYRISSIELLKSHLNEITELELQLHHEIHGLLIPSANAVK